MELGAIKDLTLIGSSLTAAITIIFGFFQYRRNMALQRAEQFSAMRRRRESSTTMNKLAELLEDDDISLRSIPWNEKIELLGFYEDVALMVNSGLMKKHVAHYMFSYYALRCWESKNFWHEVNRESHYWALFRDFVSEMKTIENSFEYKRKYYQL